MFWEYGGPGCGAPPPTGRLSEPVSVRDFGQRFADDSEVLVGQVVVHREREDPGCEAEGHRCVITVELREGRLVGQGAGVVDRGGNPLGLEGRAELVARGAGDGGAEELAPVWLRTKANSIEGGTSEIQLNIISKHVLKLPGA